MNGRSFREYYSTTYSGLYMKPGTLNRTPSSLSPRVEAWLMREFVIGQNLGHWRRPGLPGPQKPYLL